MDYLRALMDLAARPTGPALLAPPPAGLLPATAAVAPVQPVDVVGGLPQDEVDRALDVYEHYVHVEGEGPNAPDALDRSDAARSTIPAAVVAAGAREVAR